MASNQRLSRAYGFDNALQNLAPRPVVSQRAPLTTDKLEIGTTWVDVPNQTVYILVAISSNSAVWTTSPASGVGVFTSLLVTPGNAEVTIGDFEVSLGDFTVFSGNTVLGGNLTVAGITTLNGDVDISSSLLIDLVSTLDAAPSILLHANGGTSEQIQLHSDQGTSLTSVYLLSDVGGIKLYSPGLADDAAITLQADLGGLDVDVAMQLSLVSSENTANSIVISSPNGGIDITSGGSAGEDIDITASSSINLESTEDVPGCIYLHADAGTSETILINAEQGTGVTAVHIVSTVGGITLASGLASADAINLTASAGGVDIDGALQVNIASAQNAVNAIVINASAGGIDITCTSGGAGEDIDIVSTGGSVNITGSEAVTDAITLNASDVAGGIDLTAGTGAIDLVATGGDITVTSTKDAARAIYLHANGGTSESIQIRSDLGTGVASIDILSDVGGITLTSGLASDDAVNIDANSGGFDLNAAMQINIASSEAAADAILITSSNAAGGIDLTTGGGSIDLSSAGFVTMVAATDTQATPTAASTLNVNVGAVTFTGFTTAGADGQVFTITNSLATTTSQIFAVANNEGANDAQMHVTRVKRLAGSFEVTVSNVGAAALNGNVTVNFWIIG